MSKARSKAVNFLSRSAGESMTGHASGYLDVMPAGAVDLACQNGVIEQFDVLCLEVSRWELVKKARRLTPAESRRYEAAKGVWGNLKKTIREASEQERGWVFMRVANHVLKGDDLRRINTEVDRVILRNAQRRANEPVQPASCRGTNDEQ